ncbi:MAG: HlyD family efflux transporter periplasmic adaptor subunit [Hyphomicrobiales bacterium]
MLETICSLAFLSALPFCSGLDGAAFGGYVEGDYTAIAPLSVARVTEIGVRRGEHVAAGALLARVETEDAELAVRQAEAVAAEARAVVANLNSGKRPEEIAAIEASLRSAESQSREAAQTLERRQQLRARGVASQAELDQAESARDVALARVKEIEANLAVARLPARDEELAAAGQRLAQAEAALATARWQLDQRRLQAPAAGLVEDVLRHAGDTAGPTAPVISFLPDGAVKLRFYVPEEAIAEMRPGRRVAVACDGCAEGLSASISYVSPDPEFTPPVIYSVERRQKLVYLVEARPDDKSLSLRPGQIVDVRPLAE